MTDLRCAHCGVCHADHADANQSGGVGRILPWSGETCPVCLDRRREVAARAARRYVSILVDPNDDYCVPVAREQVTFEEVLG